MVVFDSKTIAETLRRDLPTVPIFVLNESEVGKTGCCYCHNGICGYDGEMWAELPFGCLFNTGNPCWALKEGLYGLD